MSRYYDAEELDEQLMKWDDEGGMIPEVRAQSRAARVAVQPQPAVEEEPGDNWELPRAA